MINAQQCMLYLSKKIHLEKMTAEELKTEFKAQLETMSSMGFPDEATNIENLKKANGNVDSSNNKELGRALSEDTHGQENPGNKMEERSPQNAVIKNIKSDILNGFAQRRNDEGGFKVII